MKEVGEKIKRLKRMTRNRLLDLCVVNSKRKFVETPKQ